MREFFMAAFAWWFIFGAGAELVQFGPFKEKEDCEAMAKEQVDRFEYYIGRYYASKCWEGTVDD